MRLLLPVLLVLLIPVLVGFYLLDRQQADRLYANQIAACERGNMLRREVNDVVEVLDGFIAEAARARAASGDREVADEYLALRVELDRVTVPNCRVVIARP